jgi:hypothetical protein
MVVIKNNIRSDSKPSKKIKRHSELPAWFALEKYEGTKHLDAAGWYEQLLIRRICLFMFTDKTTTLDELGTPYYILNARLNIVRDNPIVDTAQHFVFSHVIRWTDLYELKPRKPQHTFGIHAMTTGDLMHLESKMTEKKRQYMQGLLNELLDSQNKDKQQYNWQPWMDKPLYRISNHLRKSFKRPILLDLALPDEVLIEHFKHYLPILRKTLCMSKEKVKMKKLNYKHWAELGLLPYLDLKIWGYDAHVSITNHVMADAILKRGFGSEEMVRKTIAPLALQLLTDESLRILAAQAAYEITEQDRCFPEVFDKDFFRKNSE